MRRLIPFLFLLLSIPLVAKAQVPQVKPGDRIRVTAPECELLRAKGTFIAFDADQFSATMGDGDVHCPVDALTRMEVSMGKRSILLSAFVGAAIPVLAGFLFESSNDCEGICFLVSVIYGAPAGFLVGGLSSVIRGRDKWRGARLPYVQPSLSLSTGNRLHLGFSIPLRR